MLVCRLLLRSRLQTSSLHLGASNVQLSLSVLRIMHMKIS